MYRSNSHEAKDYCSKSFQMFFQVSNIFTLPPYNHDSWLHIYATQQKSNMISNYEVKKGFAA